MLFSYRLAERLHMTREELVSRMTWHEFQNWIAIAQMDYRERQVATGAEEPDIIDQLDQISQSRRRA